MHQIPINPSASVRTGYLSLGREGVGEAAHVVLEGTLVTEELNVGTVDTDAALLALGDVLLAAEGSEAPVLGDDDLLATGELVLRAAESLNSGGAVWKYMSAPDLPAQMAEKLTGVTGADGQKDLADVDTGDSAVGLAPGTTHTSLQSIGTGTRQHLVDTDDVVRVGTDTEVEGFLSTDLDEVLVGANTGGFKSLRAQLLVLVGNEVDAERELIDTGTLAAKIEDANLGVGDTTVETRLGVRLVPVVDDD